MQGDSRDLCELATLAPRAVLSLPAHSDKRRAPARLLPPVAAEVVIFPSAMHLESTKDALKVDAKIGVQNIHSADKLGAFTGELVVPQVQDMGLEWVMVGHSERRHVFGEGDELVAEKARVALAAGLKVVVCVGEKLDEREAGHCRAVVVRQLDAVAAVVPAESWATSVVIAYEPVWAIGTGKVASAEQAQEAHKDIREWLEAKIGAAASSACRVVYGGSVKPGNCSGLGAQPDIDGFLVGGAALKPEFVDIIRGAQA